MKIAALDLGSNTFLCLIAEVEGHTVDTIKITKIYDDQVRVVRLGQDLSSQPHGQKRFHPEALLRAKKCLEEFSLIIAKNKPEKILAMATSAARDAVNKEELFEICRQFKIPIEIIPGEREAEITYLGGTSGLKNCDKNTIIIDIGGGSTELIYGTGKKILFSKSLDIGCVRLTEKFLPTQPSTEENLSELTHYIEQTLKPVTDKIKSIENNAVSTSTLIAVAGTPTELAKIQIGSFDAEKIDGYQFPLEQLINWREKFSKCSPEQIIEKYKVSPGRADVLLIGVIILISVCKLLGQSKLEVSTRGVRFGVALEIARKELI